MNIRNNAHEPAQFLPGIEPGAPGRAVTTAQRLHELLTAGAYEPLRDALVHAELAGEISELHALNFHAMLAAIERSECARDYLEMAEAAAQTPSERAMVAETWATYRRSTDTAREVVGGVARAT
jgi:hypothetical protein